MKTNTKLFDFGENAMHTVTKVVTVVTKDNQSFCNVFRNEYKYVGNINENTEDDTRAAVNTDDIFSTFVKTYGTSGQLYQVVEELGELSHEILKYNRYTMYTEKKEKILPKLIEEFGDVLNALDSMVYVLKLDMEDIHKARITKLLKYHANLIK